MWVTKGASNILRLIVIFIIFAVSISSCNITKEISNIKQNARHTKVLANNVLQYKSLPIEKLDKLNFIDAKTLSIGTQEMKKHQVVFAGISRDNAAELPFVMRHVEYIGKFFADYRVIVFENDSSDGTKQILRFWRDANPKVHVASQDFHNKKRLSIKFLADVRNIYLDLLQDKEYEGFDIVILLDMDMWYGFDVRGIQNSFSKIDKWDMVCSNGVDGIEGLMYDLFAFRNEAFNDHMTVNKINDKKYFRDHIAYMYKAYDVSSELMPVYSCFGGLAIYKRELFEGCYYDSEDEDCEHVYLHQCMRSKHNARIFMNPAQLIRYTHYHN